MKFQIIFEFKEPFEESYVKALEIERKMRSRFTHSPFYLSMGIPMKCFSVFDGEPEEIMRWSKEYSSVFNAKVIPVMTREEWANL
jgi:hypothetical protein